MVPVVDGIGSVTHNSRQEYHSALGRNIFVCLVVALAGDSAELGATPLPVSRKSELSGPPATAVAGGDATPL